MPVKNGNFDGRWCISISNHVNTTPDQELIDGCLAGQVEAFGLLVNRYQHRLYGSLVHVTGSSEQAKDIAQDAFLQAFEKLSTFRGQSQFYSWLFRIALNAAVSARRKTRRISSSTDAIYAATGQETPDYRTDGEPGRALELAEQQKIVHQALSELTEEFRTPLVLKELDGLKYDEIAEILQIPVGTVRSRIHRGRMELRQKLQTALQERPAERDSKARNGRS